MEKLLQGAQSIDPSSVLIITVKPLKPILWARLHRAGTWNNFL